LVYHKGKVGETYNIGGKNERTNIYIANKICEILDELNPTFVKDRPGHDKRYAIDATKIENELDWRANENFESGIIKTIKWYIKRYIND